VPTNFVELSEFHARSTALLTRVTHLYRLVDLWHSDGESFMWLTCFIHTCGFPFTLWMVPHVGPLNLLVKFPSRSIASYHKAKTKEGIVTFLPTKVNDAHIIYNTN